MVDYENKSAQAIYGCEIYGSVLVNEMPKSARYHIDMRLAFLSLVGGGG